MKVIITVDSGIARYGHRLATLADKLPQAEREGLKEGGDLTRTLIRRTLKAQMNTKRQGDINSHTSGGLAGDNLYIIRGMGKGLPIKDFPVRGGKEMHGDWRDQPRLARGRFGPLHDKGGVSAEPWGNVHKFWRSFRRNGEFLSRRANGRVQRLYGPSVAKEIGKDQSAAAFESQAAENVERCIIRRIGRLI
jgi:hypothetical protein